MRQQVTGVVLAGGQARRMGRDKAELVMDGASLLDRAIASVAEVSSEVLVVGRTLARNDIASLPDERAGQGPLAGIETALRHATHPIVVIVAVDHPWVAPSVLSLLIDEMHATRAVPSNAHPFDAHDDRSPGQPDLPVLAALLGTHNGPQPLIGAYRRAALPTISGLLDAGERRAMTLVRALNATVVAADTWRHADPGLGTAVDLDTPVDVAVALRQRPVTVARFTSDKTDSGNRFRLDPCHPDTVVVEEPLEIRACGPDQAPRTLVTTLRTPGNDDALAAGWCFSEGLLTPGSISRIDRGDPVAMARPDDQITLRLTHSVDTDAAAHRHTTATASCGVCGRASIDELALRCRPLTPEDAEPVNLSLLADLPPRLREHQTVFGHTGGLHATGLFDHRGELRTVAEDVGRHNALDAAIGTHVLAGEGHLSWAVAVLSGRLGFELIVKAAVARIGVVVSVGAPTDLAVRTAARFGITIVGFVRNGRGNVYTHARRVVA